jgi:aspartyl-tRNA(Asn)/glutamyl-tRNA(Gln) amidotransferase subunit A
MIISRRDALLQLSALFAVPIIRWPDLLSDPLAGTIIEYQAGRVRRDWTAVQVTKEALERANA